MGLDNDLSVDIMVEINLFSLLTVICRLVSLVENVAHHAVELGSF